MSYKDLHTFIEDLDRSGELKRIQTEVSAELEITEITDRVSKAHGPALLFEKVTGSKYPVLINAMGSYRRISMGLGVKELDELGLQVANYLELGNYLSIKKLIQNIPHFLQLLHVFPARRRLRGRCQEIIEADPDLDTLPVLRCWPEDAGRFFTLPLVFTKDIRTKRQNVGMYRMQILDRKTTGMHWHKHKDGSEIYQGYKENGQRMPVSVALGCDPAITYAATAPLPNMIDEMLLAGWLRSSRVRMVKCITNDIYVPDNAEFILEGYVDPTEELVLEGPFGDHTGYYSLADYYPRFHVTCITHRKNAVYPATVVGKPPMEDCYMAKATERIFLPMLKLIIPELVDMNLPLEGVFHNCAIVSIKVKYPGCAFKVMNGIWGMGQMMYTKLIVVVDDTVDVQNLSQVRDAVLAYTEAADSLFLAEGPLDALDHSSNRALFGTRLGVDATSRERGACGSSAAAEKVNSAGSAAAEKANSAGSEASAEKANSAGSEASAEKVNSAGSEAAAEKVNSAGSEAAANKVNSAYSGASTVKNTYHILTVFKQTPGQGRDVLKEYMGSHADKFVIVIDDIIDPKDLSTVMWKVFNNIDAGRDLVIEGGKIGIDATKKWKEEGLTRDWPEDIVMTEKIKQQVDERWKEYGIDENHQ